MPAKIEKVWSCYGGCHFNGRENGHITVGRFKGGRIVMVRRLPV